MARYLRPSEQVRSGQVSLGVGGLEGWRGSRWAVTATVDGLGARRVLDVGHPTVRLRVGGWRRSRRPRRHEERQE